MKIVLNLQFLTCKKYSEHRSTVKNCNFSRLQFFKCTSTVIPLHIFAVQFQKIYFDLILPSDLHRSKKVGLTQNSYSILIKKVFERISIRKADDFT